MDGVLEKAAVQRARAAIAANGMSGEIKLLSDSARTAAEAASALGIDVGQIASSLVFKLPNDKPLLVITSGRHRVDTARVAQHPYRHDHCARSRHCCNVGVERRPAGNGGGVARLTKRRVVDH